MTLEEIAAMLDGAALAIVRYTALGALLAAEGAPLETPQPRLTRLREDAAAKLFEVAAFVGDGGHTMADRLSHVQGLPSARLAHGIHLVREDGGGAQTRTLLCLLADDLALAGCQIGEDAEAARADKAREPLTMPTLAAQLDRTALALVQLSGLYLRMNAGVAPSRKAIEDRLRKHRKATLSALADLGAVVGPAELPLGAEASPAPAAVWLVRGGHITRGSLAELHDRIAAGTAERVHLQEMAEDLTLAAAQLAEWARLSARGEVTASGALSQVEEQRERAERAEEAARAARRERALDAARHIAEIGALRDDLGERLRVALLQIETLRKSECGVLAEREAATARAVAAEAEAARMRGAVAGLAAALQSARLASAAAEPFEILAAAVDAALRAAGGRDENGGTP